MTDQLPDKTHTAQPQKPSYPPVQSPQMPPHEGHEGHQGHGGHGLMMIACCIPMLIIVGVLVVTGVVGVGAIAYAVLCTVMMALMMFAMPGHRH